MKTHSLVRARTAKWTAAVVAALLGLSGSVVGVAGAALAAAAPSVTVTPATDLDVTVENTVTVSGSAFEGDGAANGVYVSFGPASNWAVGTVPPGSGWTTTQWVRAADITAGAFTVDLVIPADALDAAGSYGVATFAAGALSVTDRTLDTFTEVTLKAVAPPTPPTPVIPAPELAVSKTAGLAAAGEALTVTGTNYTTSATGVYVQFGWINANWRPSLGATGTDRSSAGAYTKWVQTANATGGPYVQWADNGDGTSNFTTTVTVTKSVLDAAKKDGYTLAVFTVGASGVVQADNEHSVALSFAEPTTPDTPTTPTIPTTPTAPTGPTAPTTSGVSLSVSPNSVDATVANTFTITGSGYTGAGAANGVYVNFGSAGIWQPGQVPGQGGWLSSVWVQPSSVVGGSFTTTIVVPANTLEAGVSYGVGTFAAHGLALTDRSLDAWAPVSLNGAAASTSVAPSATPIRTPAATPPATDGIETKGADPVEGGTITVTAQGYQPGETGILVVIYSTPTVLDRSATADATGVVTWTGKLPVGLTGKHTLTFQGSVQRGVVLDISASDASGCAVSTATLTWGFKESFRSYISGSIANGEWTPAEGATYDIPNFGWSDGTGAYEAEGGLVSFVGSVTFTGHGGVLNTTIANPRLQFVDKDTAVLLLDVSGTTQDGATVEQRSVEFVDIDLAGAGEDADGTLTVADAATTLTAAGAEAFGTYPAGEAFDPVSFTVETECASAVVADAETVNAEPVASGSDLAWLWILIAAVLLLAIAAVAVIVLRRRTA